MLKLIMGKKATKASVKIPKKNENNKDFSSWIKVLKPKVYITDTSSFKQLVQELTGNGTTSSSTPPSKPHQEVEKVVPVIHIEEEDRGEPESSAEISFDASADTWDLSNDQMFWDQDFGNQVWNGQNQMCFEETNLVDWRENQEVDKDLFGYWDVEPWLLETDPYHLFSSQVEGEVSIYDYELSGLL